jgi:outer membrane murein-binding lipoprotein Lpp
MSCLNLSRPPNRTLWIGWLLTLILVLGGCVSVNDFKGVQREAEALGVELRMEQLRAQELEGKVHRLNVKVRELERAAQATREETARRERE